MNFNFLSLRPAKAEIRRKLCSAPVLKRFFSVIKTHGHLTVTPPIGRSNGEYKFYYLDYIIILSSELYSLRGESHIDFRTQCVIMTQTR